jgi:putative SOS response-associated peptidase YedK
MCGRYASARSVDDLAATFGIAEDDVDAVPAPDWNVAPTKPVPAVLVRDGRRVLTTLRWGLVPAWSDGVGGPAPVNARVESVTEKPSFRDAVRRRRCLLPADGWYEWRRFDDGRRVPHYLCAEDGAVLALAGIWEVWYDGDGRPLRSTAVVTGSAPADLAHLHDRAPLVVPAAQWQHWLDPATSLQDVVAMLRPTAAGTVQAWPVSERVGDVRAAGPELTRRVPVDEQPALF